MREAAVEQAKRYDPAVISAALSTALSILKRSSDVTCDRPVVANSTAEAVPAKKKMRMHKFVKPTSTVASAAVADIDENHANHVVDRLNSDEAAAVHLSGPTTHR